MNLKGRRIIIVSVIVCIVSICMVSIFGWSNEKVDREKLISNRKIRNDVCAKVLQNVDESGEKYKKLLEEDEDSFMRGVYSAALSIFYVNAGDYDKAIEYHEKAVENYNKVEHGEYYSIMERKYFAWVMLNYGKYTESFKITSELFEMINKGGYEVLTEQDMKDTQALIYIIYAYIYSELNIFDKAEIYYNKLCELESESTLSYAILEKIPAVKINYGLKIEDVTLISEGAAEIYEVMVEKDKQSGGNYADTTLSNVAIANIMKGNLEIALEQIKKAEASSIKNESNYDIAAVYTVYAIYYEEINENELAIEYMEKAINMMEELGNNNHVYNITKTLIKFLEENNIEGNIYKHYKKYYELAENSEEDKIANNLLSQIIDTNDELNNITLELLAKEGKESKKRVIVAILVIILLGIMLIRMYYLINEKNKAKKDLEEIANKDYLTKVSTRSYGEKLILDEINNGKELSIAIIDIDNFKNINDTYGHMFGDVILKSVAKEIRQGVSENDVVIRFGGEEFVVAFIDKDKEEGKKILDKIRIDVNNIVFENDVRVSFSAGIENWDKTYINLVIKKSDELLYKAKREGKNRVISS